MASKKQSLKKMGSASLEVATPLLEEILKGERAEYGGQIVSTLSRQLETEYGQAFSEKGLRHMLRFAEAFSAERIVSPVLRQLGWIHSLPGKVDASTLDTAIPQEAVL